MTNIVHDDDIRASPIPHNISTTSATPVGEDLTTLSRDELVLKLQAARNTIDENGRGMPMAF